MDIVLRASRFTGRWSLPGARRVLQRPAAPRVGPEHPPLTRVPAPPNDPLRH